MTELIIGLDSSTQSAKAIAWDRDGRAVAEGRAAIPLSTPQSGRAEQDPQHWWDSACRAICACCEALDPARVRALAISNQRETVGLFDADAQPLLPAMVWLDERARADVAQLAGDFGAERLHRISGKPADITPIVYRLHWLRRQRPALLDGAAKILSVHGYLSWRLAGEPVCSWTSADPFGTFDLERHCWSAPILDHLGLRADQFGRPAPPGTEIGRLHSAAAAATGLPAATPLISAGGDGHCAGLGVDAVHPGRVYLNLGTAQITGAWAAQPHICLDWRTLCSPTGSGYFLEGVQRAGTFLIDWYVERFAGGDRDGDAHQRLSAQAAALPIGCEGLRVSPYLCGCMDPHWDLDARASFSGLGPHHGAAHLYRGILEALTLETWRCVQSMRARALAPAEVVAVGGGANNPLWLQMIADACQLPVLRSESPEASSLGAAICAAAALGWYPDIAAAAAGMSRCEDACGPAPENGDAWAALAAG